MMKKCSILKQTKDKLQPILLLLIMKVFIESRGKQVDKFTVTEYLRHERMIDL